MWELDCQESWVQKNWCFQTVVLEKTLESPLECKEIKQSTLKEINLGRTDVEAEAPILWPHDAKSQLIGKKLWSWGGWRTGGEGDDRGWDGWYHGLNGQEFEQTPGDGETGKPGVLQPMQSQTVGHDLVTKQQQARVRTIRQRQRITAALKDTQQFNN